MDVPVEGCWCSGIRPNTRFTDDTDLDNSALPLFRTTLNLLPFIWLNIIVLIPHVLEGNDLGIFSQKETPLGLCNSLYSRLDFSLLTNLFKISLILVFFFFPPNPSKQFSILPGISRQGVCYCPIEAAFASKFKSRIPVTQFELLYYRCSYPLRMVISWEVPFLI